MDNKVKKCKQCGQFRGIDEYRVYYNQNKKKPPGRYTVCKTCEAINQRWKYLNTKLTKDTITMVETQEKAQIEDMYELLREAGLEPPRRKVEIVSNVPDLVSDIMAATRKTIERREEAEVELDTPDELVDWLTKDLQGYHPDELEKVSDRLWAKFRPETGLDENYKPVFDDRFRETLDRIQDRFDEYEDNYAW